MSQIHMGALVVGAGFGGIYQLKKLVDLGLSTQVIDAAGDDLLQYHWKEHYVKQPEVLAYLEHVVARFDLRKHMLFNTELKSADYDHTQNGWIIRTSTGKTFATRYLVTALGLLSKQTYPDIHGINSFEGELYHTGAWPKSHDFRGKRVGVIGNGSTGVQVITALAKEVKELTCFQRTPQYSVPSGNGPVSPEYREHLNANYDDIWKQVKNSAVAFGFEESTFPAMSVSEVDRQPTFEEAWQKGNGFRFMFWTFCDITYDEAANKAASDFIKKKIHETVQDPEKARKLTPSEYYARRPLCDAGYYEQFNRDNVDVVNLKATPITELTPSGIKTADSKLHTLDVIVFATGFDAVDGNSTRLAIQGRGGESLKDSWAEAGPTSYLGVSVPNFPNMFMITGPNGPFTNTPPTIETHVEFTANAIARTEGIVENRKSQNDGVADGQNKGGATHSRPLVIEATADAEEDWTKLCDEMSANSLFRKANSWIFGANVPGKKNSVMFCFGGLANYRKELNEVIGDGYRGFKPL